MSTETGTPIQYMEWNKKGHWEIRPAVISMVDESNVSIIVFNKKQNICIKKSIHADFKEKGKGYWDFIPNKDGGQFRNNLYPWINPDGRLEAITVKHSKKQG